ncbi:MAG: hypothetical protein GZ090_11185 [Oxalobacteraceae bacterium]|nr:hypothetical protein [Oxalobacteraceae bacterium]
MTCLSPRLASCTLLLLAIAAPMTAQAQEFPTSSRVEYVFECMKNHDSKYEYLYKCSCAIDAIAKQLSFDDYAELSTAKRHQGLGGERGAEFRDPTLVKQMVRKYQQVEQVAANACFIQ